MTTARGPRRRRQGRPRVGIGSRNRIRSTATLMETRGVETMRSRADDPASDRRASVALYPATRIRWSRKSGRLTNRIWAKERRMTQRTRRSIDAADRRVVHGLAISRLAVMIATLPAGGRASNRNVCSDRCVRWGIAAPGRSRARPTCAGTRDIPVSAAAPVSGPR